MNFVWPKASCIGFTLSIMRIDYCQNKGSAQKRTLSISSHPHYKSPAYVAFFLSENSHTFVIFYHDVKVPVTCFSIPLYCDRVGVTETNGF